MRRKEGRNRRGWDVKGKEREEEERRRMVRQNGSEVCKEVGGRWEGKGKEKERERGIREGE